jgi:hypothetical protein
VLALMMMTSLRLKPSSAIMAPPFLGFKQINSAWGLIEEVQESDENRIRFRIWRTASDQVE